MIAVDEDRIARADIVFSIVPPAEALALAERLVPALTRSPRKPIFVDCNAISTQTVKQVAAIIAPTGAHFVDGAIIGGPPKPGEPGPTFYFSGGPAADLEGLRDYELTTRTIASQIGATRPRRRSSAKDVSDNNDYDFGCGRGAIGPMHPALGIAVGLVVGLVAGALNGWMIARFKIPDFIATLGSITVFRG